MDRNRRRSSAKQLAMLGTLLLLATSVGAQPEVPDFAHFDRPHVFFKHPGAGFSQRDQFAAIERTVGSQPVLVVPIYFPDRIAPPLSPEYLRDMMFGASGSISAYFEEVSYDRFSLQDAGVLTWQQAPQSSDFYFGGGGFNTLAVVAVEMAIDAGFDFDGYDTNADCQVTRDELIIQFVVGPNGRRPLPGYVMATRLDQRVDVGVFTPSGTEVDTWAVAGKHTQERVTFAHELGHAVLHLADLYNDHFGEYPSRGFSLMAEEVDETMRHLSPWEKIHLGWLAPTVVTQTGPYTIPAIHQTPVAYILYDPAKGEQEYFIVENRTPSGDFETENLDQGLAVWHITEYYTEENEISPGRRARKTIGMQWAGGPDAQFSPPWSSLWDCSDPRSCYDLSDDSTPADLRWADGTPSGVQIRDISEAGPLMTAYFVVPHGGTPVLFLRGDCNDDGTVDIADPVALLFAVFLGELDITCDDACDSNDDGAVDISDAINTLGVLFLGNGLIPLPGMTECGVDPTEDKVSCDAFERCP